MTDLDNRGDLPSASSMERYSACRGSYLLSKGITEVQTPEMKAWAEAGDRIHTWLAMGADFIDLEPDELEVAEACAEQRDILIRHVFGENSSKIVKNKEERLWLKDGKRRIASGKPDDISTYEVVALVIDFKSSRGDITESPANLQLRTLAVLHWVNNGRKLKKVTVAISQPLARKDPVLTLYEEEELKRAEAELRELLADIVKPDRPLTAGSHCKFCPARFKCPAIKLAVELVASFKEEPIPEDGEKIAKLLSLAAIVEPVIKSWRAYAKESLKGNINSIPGWTLSKPSSVRSITDPAAVFKVLNEAALITRDQFFSDCISVGIGDLEKAVVKYNNSKPAKAKETVNALCSEFIELKPKEPSLEQL